MKDPRVPGARPIRILIVEDSRTQAHATQAELEQEGFLVEVQPDGVAGLAAAESGGHDVVLSDVVMPVMDGFELCRRFKATSLGKRTIVILYSSLSDPLDMVRGLECGADAFVTKPSPASRLRGRIERLLEGQRVSAEGANDAGIKVVFLGQEFIITAERAQILSLLLATFEDAVAATTQLRQRDVDLADANRALTELARAAEQANQAKSEFLANMSHELRTPLNAVLGFSDLLEEQAGALLTERQRRFLRHIHDAGTHLLELINDVLDLSKVEAGKLELRREIMTADVLLEPVVAAMEAAARAKGQRFDVSVAEGSGLLLDPTRVRQILLNLLSNAVKFTPTGGVVALRTDLTDGDLLIEVADNGIGIPLEARDRVFGMFERLHEGRVNAAGTGLGLALTKRLVELHGGTISYESVEGQGTTFRVRLPDVRSQPISGERILLVEDNRHDADLIVALASAHQVQVEVARTGAAGRAALQRRIPLAVLISLRLPDGRGEALLRELKASDATRSVPAIVLTVEDDPGAALALGADDYLTKPFDRGRLDRWLAIFGSRRAAVTADGGAQDADLAR